MREEWVEIDYKYVVNKISTNNKKVKQKEYLQKGVYPVIDQGQDLIGGYTDDETRLLDCDIPAIVFGDHTKIVKLITFKFAPGADGTKVLVPKKFVLPKYLSYLTQILVFKIKDKGYARHYQHVEKQSFPLAPLPEQRAIVAKVEQLFSELDNGISNLKQAQEKLEIYRQAVLKKAFEGEFTNPNLKGRNLPAKWRLVKLGEVTELNPKIENKSSVNDALEVQFVPMKLVDEVIGNIHLTETRKISEVQKKSYTYFSEGDILFAKVTPCMENGKIAVAKKLKNGIGYGSSEFHVFRCSDEIQNQYLFYFLVQSIFRRDAQHAMTGAVGLRRVPKKFLEDYLIPLAPIQEQTQIVQEIETRLSVCDNILTNIEGGLEKSEALRQSILKQAFEGKLLSESELETCRKEPDWEPVEKLLESIKSGKETSSKKVKEPAKQPSKKKVHHVEYYKRILLAAEIVWQLHKQPTLGHLKLQKLIYLCQESGNMQLPTNFLQQVAGPYDPQMARSIDKQLKTKKWFAYQKNELLKYAPLEKAGGHQADFNKYYANDINNIQRIIKLFKIAKSDQIEIVTTLYACWKKIIREKAVFSENLLIKRFYEWSEEKSKYPESRVKKASEWMQEKGVVPVSTKKQTINE